MTLIPDVVITRADRRPTISIPRAANLEAHIQIALFWNGTLAPNGDGIPGGEAAIDYTRPLAGPFPLYLNDQRTTYGGGWGHGPWCEPGALQSPSGGWARGPWCKGPWCVGGSSFSWQFPIPMRDGDYQIAGLYADELGNVQDAPGTVMVMRVAAVPRPPSGLTAQVSGGNLILNWWPSDEFKAVA